MSDFSNPGESSVSGEEESPFLQRNWQFRENTSPVAKDLVGQQGLFEGASSMRGPSSSSIPTENNHTSVSEQNLRNLLSDLEKSRKVGQSSSPEKPGFAPPYLNHFLERARMHYEKQDFGACLEVLYEGLKFAPGNPEVLSLIEKARQESQLCRAESGLANRIAQFKAESIKLFEQGQYSDCIGRFKLLSELEPTNHDLRDYLQISQEEAEKRKPLQPDPVIVAPLENQDIAVPQVSPPDLSAPALVSDEESFPAVNVTDLHSPDTFEISTAQLIPPAQEIQADSSNEAIPEPADNPPVEVEESPVAVQNSEMRSQDLPSARRQSEPESEADETAESPEDGVPLGTKRMKITILVGTGLVMGAVLGAWLALGPLRNSKGLEVQLRLTNGQIRTDPTPLPVDSSTSTEMQTLFVDPQTQAQKAFKQGRLLEANRLCETILEKDPNNSFALAQKQEIRERFSNLGNQAAANQQWEKAFVAWSNLLRISPNDHNAARQLKAAKANLKNQEQAALASQLELEERVQELQRQISQAVSSGRYLPPTSGNALELVRQLESLSPENTFGKEKLGQILRDLIGQTNRSLQAKDYAHASTLVKQIQMFFPENPELKPLQENIKMEETRLAESRNSWMQKAEAAMAAGHYVTPANDNVVSYCNQLLALEVQNPKALGLKKECSAKAIAQAQALVQEAKYDDAKAIYSSLFYLFQNDSQFPLNIQEIKTEIDRLTFNAYAVTHDHTLGSCTGRLRFNGYQIAFVPSSDSKDEFVQKISEIAQVEVGDRLKIQVKGKSYRFQPNATKSPSESRAKIGEIQQRLSALMASSK